MSENKSEYYNRLLQSSTGRSHKYATFVMILLIEEESLSEFTPLEICQILGMPESYEWQVKNLLKVPELLRKEGYLISPIK